MQLARIIQLANERKENARSERKFSFHMTQMRGYASQYFRERNTSEQIDFLTDFGKSHDTTNIVDNKRTETQLILPHL